MINVEENESQEPAVRLDIKNKHYKPVGGQIRKQA